MPGTSPVKVYEVTLEALTPLHVGSGEELTPLDYIHLGDRLVVVDHDRLFAELDRRRLLNDYLRRLEGGDGPLSLTKFLQEKRVRLEDVASAVRRYSIKVGPAAAGARFERRVKTVIRSQDGSVYIPGSSLKGALRTSLIYYVLQGDDGLRRNLLTKLRDARGRRIREPGRLVEGVLRRDEKGLYSDLLRALRPSDLHPEGDVETEVVGLCGLSLRDGSVRGLGFVEAVPVGTTFKGTLQVVRERSVLEHLGRSELADDLVGRVVEACNRRSRALLEREMDRLGRVGGDERVGRLREELRRVGRGLDGVRGLEALTSIGFGQGYWKTTVTAAFGSDAGTVMVAAGVRGFRGYVEVFPSGMRLAGRGGCGELLPLGWIRITLKEVMR